jgi:uncharacterized protein (DUF1697 family)
MPTHRFVALLRGINVGGRAMIAMTDLRALLESLGFTSVGSLLQSGNLVFEAKTGTPAQIEKSLETATAKRFGHPVDYFVRTAEEWNAIVGSNPYKTEADDDPSHLVVMCLKNVPKVAELAALKKAITGREYFQCRNRELYVAYPDGIGRSKFTNSLIERKLGTRGTARNWNTSLKIRALGDDA